MDNFANLLNDMKKLKEEYFYYLNSFVKNLFIFY